MVFAAYLDGPFAVVSNQPPPSLVRIIHVEKIPTKTQRYRRQLKIDAEGDK